MGDPKKQRRKYETPKHPWRNELLEAELRIMGEYGLRNKRELWRARTLLSRIRGIARSLLGKTGKEREIAEQQILGSLKRLGLLSEDATIDNILDLGMRDLLERRLQAVVFRSGMAKTTYQARQLITHGHISVGARIVRIPSYIVPRHEEDKIKFASGSPLSQHDHPLRKSIAASPVLPPETRMRTNQSTVTPK